MAWVAHIAIFLCLFAYPCGQSLADPARPVSAQARYFSMPGVPITGNDVKYGEVDADIALDGGFRVKIDELAPYIERLYEPEAYDRIMRSLEGETWVTPETASAAGIDLTFDPQSVSLKLEMSLEDKVLVELDMGGASGRPVAYDKALAPAGFSSFLNLYAGPSLAIDHSGDTVDFGSSIQLDGAMRYGELALRGRATADVFTENSVHSEFQLIRDFPDNAMRLVGGDIDSAPGEFLQTDRMLGVGLTKDIATFQPWRNIRATSSESFQLSSTSTVEVFVNDIRKRRFRLIPGRYTLTDLRVSVLRPGFETPV